MPIKNFVLAFFACGSTLWLVRMFIAYRRSRMAPKCWCCGMSKVVPWKIHHSDYFALLSMMVPLRCLGCLTRFYGLRWVRPASRKSASTKRPPVPQPQIIPVRLSVHSRLDESKSTAVAVSN